MAKNYEVSIVLSFFIHTHLSSMPSAGFPTSILDKQFTSSSNVYDIKTIDLFITIETFC